MQVQNWPGFFCLCFFAVVFIQSGLDKLFNYKRESAWVTQKFAHSILYRYVSLLFLGLTLSELLSGGLAIAGVLQLLFTDEKSMAIIGSWAICLTSLMLVFGQRINRDYIGAAGSVPYFIVAVLGLFFLT